MARWRLLQYLSISNDFFRFLFDEVVLNTKVQKYKKSGIRQEAWNR